jgi:hypothetical protein
MSEESLKSRRSSPIPSSTLRICAENTMTELYTTSLGDLIDVLYEQYMELYGDEDLASVAAAATINEMIADSVAPSRGSPAVQAENAA